MQPSDAAPSEAVSNQSGDDERGPLARTLMWIGVGMSVAGLGAAVAYTIVRSVLNARRPPDDPTSQRIQQLIDEANSLLKTLGDQRNSA